MQPAPQNFLDNLSDLIANNLPEFLLRLLAILILLLIGRWLALRLSVFVERLLQRNEADKTVTGFVTKSVYVLVLVLVFIVALTWIGVPTTSIIAVLGASTLAIGLALQESLSNLASGLLLVFLKPFVVDDYVQIGSDNNEGTVTHVRFFHTELNTADNKVLLVPNSDVMSNQILNFPRHGHRRIDLVVGIGYDADMHRAKAILTEIVQADPRILPEPAPRIAVNELGESSVNLVVRPYVRTDEYDATRTDLLEQIKLSFDEAGIVLNPQRAVRLLSSLSEGQPPQADVNLS